MQLAELVMVLEQIAPPRFAETWDNVGLLVGDPAQSVSNILLTIDYTPDVAREARDARCDAVIAYHPPIFSSLKRIDPYGVIHDAICRGVAIYSPHTALDVAPGGTNDVLADVLGLTDRHPLRLAETKSAHFKLVTFVPRQQLEKVSAAIFAAGAGRIGQYSSCSFRSEGTGTFFGEEGTNPTVGESGRLEEAAEVRLETVVPIQRVGQVIAALRGAHPYEEPAFDLNQLAAAPESIGQGRIGSFDPPVERAELCGRIKRGLGIDHLLIAGPTEGTVARAAVCAGSCGELLSDAIAAGADLYLTGEMRHHDALRAAAAGVTVVCTLHSNSERLALTHLQRRLEQALPAAKFLLSRTDRDPFVVR
jgi:dinuclear metal center YbgI/SA1388 family protein